jgi:hypothetical protein
LSPSAAHVAEAVRRRPIARMAKGIPLLITIYTPFQGQKGQSLAERSGRSKILATTSFRIEHWVFKMSVR